MKYKLWKHLPLWVFLLVAQNAVSQDTTFGYGGIILKISTVDGNTETVRHFHTNGKRESTETLVNGLREGEYREWHINGSTKLEARYDKGLLTGEKKEWADNGQLLRSMKYELAHHQDKGTESRLTGKYREYSKNGQAAIKGQYVSGLKSGKWLEWSDLGTLLSKNYYVSGARKGLCTVYYPSGQLKSKTEYEGYLNPRSKKYDDRVHGKSIGYFENGDLKYKGEYLHGKRNGEILSYWNNGQLRNIHHYENDTMLGKQLDYFDDGKIKSEYQLVIAFKEGKRIRVKHGRYIRSNQDESEKDIQYYDTGEHIGVWLNYRNGYLHSEKTHYLKDSVERQLNFNANGDTVGVYRYRFFYKNGRRELETLGYNMAKNSNGELKYEFNFDRDRNGWKKDYHYNGQLKSSQTVDLSRDIHHIIKEFHESGTPKNRYGYRIHTEENGKMKTKLHGPHKTFAENGQLLKTAKYNEGALLGSTKSFFMTGEIREFYIPLSGDADNPGRTPCLNFNFFADGSLQKLTVGQFWVEWFNDGGLKSISEMGTVKHPTYKITWNTNGTVNRIQAYNSKKGSIQRSGEAVAKQYFEIFDHQNIAGTSALKDSNFTGPFIIKLPDGGRWIDGNMNKGLLDGDLVARNLSGTDIVKAYFTSGLLEGRLEVLTFNGLPYMEITHQKGRIQGKKTVFREDGTKDYELEFDQGDYIGITRFYENGKPRSYNGPNRTSKDWNEQGQLISSKLIHCNDSSGCDSFYSIAGFHEDGTIQTQGKQDLKNGKIGEWKTFHKNGKLASRSNYENNKLSGTYAEGDENGDLLAHGNYNHGNRVGKWQIIHEGTLTHVFYRKGKLVSILEKVLAPCECVDTTFQTPNLATPLRTLVAEEDFIPYLFPFHKNNTDWYGKLFFSGLQFQGSSYSLDVLSRMQVGTEIPGKEGKGLYFIVNTCPNYDGMYRTATHVEYGGSKMTTYTWLESPRSAIRMKNGLFTAIDSTLPPDTVIDQLYYFKAEDIEYGKDGIVLGEVAESCMPQTLVGRSGMIAKLEGQAFVNLFNDYRIGSAIRSLSFLDTLPELIKKQCNIDTDVPGFYAINGVLTIPLKLGKEQTFFETKVVTATGGYDFFSFVVSSTDEQLLKDPKKTEVALLRRGMDNVVVVLSKNGKQLYLSGTYKH